MADTVVMNLKNFPRGLTSGDMVRVVLTGRVTGFQAPVSDTIEEQRFAMVEVEASDVDFEPLTFRDAAEMAQARVAEALRTTPLGIGQESSGSI